jgi:hypothetical protein
MNSKRHEWDWWANFRKVLDCGSPLPLCVASLAVEKRQRAAAVQDAVALFTDQSISDSCPFVASDFSL